MELEKLQKPDTAALTLSTLPEDIIRLIIHAAGQPKDRLRLIYRSWNAMVVEYLADRRNHPPFPGVHFYAGDLTNEKDVVVKVELSPHHHYMNTFKGWTHNVHTNKNDTMESPSLRVRVITWDRRTVILASLMFLIETSAVAFRIHYILSLIILAFAAFCLVYYTICYRPAAVENRERLRRIFSRCSSIGTLHLHEVNRETLDIVRKTLGGVPIKSLVVYDEACDQNLREKILKWARVHKVEKITVCTKKFVVNKLGNFLLAATETANEVEIYESTANSDKIFGVERDYWDKKAQAMSDGSFTVRVMNGQELQDGDGTQLLRFKIGA